MGEASLQRRTEVAGGFSSAWLLTPGCMPLPPACLPALAIAWASLICPVHTATAPLCSPQSLQLPLPPRVLSPERTR